MINSVLLGSGLTILLALIGWMYNLSVRVSNNRNDITAESVRSKSEDRHHQGELDAIKDSLKSINIKLDKIVHELLGNGNGNGK